MKTMILKSLSFLAALAVVFVTAWAPKAHAGQTGELEGYVVDDAGLPVVGARVILESPQMIGGPKTGVTDADGRFRFPALDPGVYSVEISHASFRGYKEEKIAIGIDSKVTKDYLLEPNAKVEEGEQVIHVVAAAPMVDTSNTSEGMSIRPDFTDRTVTSRDYQGVALFVPGVIDVTGSGNPAIHGGLPVSNLWLLDGLNIGDPVTQTFSANFNFDAVGEEQVLTGGLKAEYGATRGGVINIVTKSGGDDFTFDGSVYWAPSELHLTDPGEVINSNETNVNVSVGGPIIRKKLWFFLSGQYVDSLSTTPLTNKIFPDVPVLPPEHFNAFYGLGKLTWAVLPWQKVSLLVQGDPTWITNETQSPTVHPKAEAQRFQGGARMVGTSESTLSENLLWKTQLGYSNNRIHDFPESNDFSTPGHTNNTTGTATINDSSITDDYRYRMVLASSLTYFLENFVGDHEIKVGAGGELQWNTFTFSETGNPKDCVAGGVHHASCEFVDQGITHAGSSISGAGDPFQLIVWDGALTKTVGGNNINAYVQDTWKPTRSITINPGLRFDSSRAYADKNDGGVQIFDFETLSPRFGVAWDPFGDNKTVIRGGFYVYQENGLLEATGWTGHQQPTSTYQFDPATNAYSKLISTSNGDDQTLTFKKGMKAPIMYETTFGVQREIFEDAAISVDFTYRYRQNDFEDDESNIIWNTVGDSQVGFVNGKPTFVFSLGTPDQAMGIYYGIDVAFQKRLSDNWQALITYTLSRNEGTNEEYGTTAFDRPRQAPFEFGFLANDVRHSANMTLSYDLPFGFIVGGTASYQSGAPDSKFFLNHFYNDFNDRRAPRGFDPKNVNDPTDDVELRFPDHFFVSARVAWRLKELTTQDIWLIADVSNLFDSRPPISIEDRDLPPGSPTQFGQVLAKGGPTAVQLALRYMF
jgi:hypothetical protein